MEVSSTMYLEIAQSSVIATIGTHPPISIALSPYDASDGRLYQPISLAERLQKLVAPFITDNQHVVVYCPALAHKSGDEIHLITLQIALMLSKLGWVLDLITDDPRGQKDYLVPFRPPVYQSLTPWLVGFGLAVVVALVGLLGYAAHCKSGITQKHQENSLLRRQIEVVQEDVKTQQVSLKQQKILAVFEKKALKSQAHNRILNDFIEDVVSNIPEDCWLEKFECSASNFGNERKGGDRVKTSKKKESTTKIKKIPFMLEGKAYHEKSIAVFFSALLASHLVDSIELVAPHEYSAKKLGIRVDYLFVMKGHLKPISV